jgi:hypothetical protein
MTIGLLEKFYVPQYAYYQNPITYEQKVRAQIKKTKKTRTFSEFFFQD